MISKPTVLDLLEKQNDVFRLVIATAKRARQISKGSPRLIIEKEENPVTQAANEIEKGRLKIFDEKAWKEEKNKRENKK